MRKLILILCLLNVAVFPICLYYVYRAGKPQNDKQELRKSAERGDAVAQTALGLNYKCGLGVKQDYAEAVKWYRKAAEQGYSIAQYELGRCYAEGKGVERDHAEVIKWYRKAAEKGYILAQAELEELEK